MPTASNVTYGKAKVSGAVYIAAAGTTLPTDATTALNPGTSNDYIELGYVSEDGLVNTNTAETNQIRAWGGDVVLTALTAKPDTFQFTLIESLNIEVLKAVYGSSNITGTLSTGITVKASASTPPDAIYVFEVQDRGGINRRIVLPNAALQEVGAISYTDGEATGYQITLSAQPDSSGFTHYEYIK